MKNTLRESVAYFAKELKTACGYSYTDLEGLTGLTRKQISAILHGEKGVSFDKIEEFFEKGFDTSLSLVTERILCDNE